MSAALEAAKQALAEALPLDGDPNEALDVIFGMVGELSWQLVNFFDDLEEDGTAVPSSERLALAQYVEGKLGEALERIIEAAP